jgi:hypothetical protein
MSSAYKLGVATLVLVPISLCAACRERKEDPMTSMPSQVPPAASTEVTTATASAQPPPPPLTSTLALGDAAFAGQLVKGFYAIENGSWRWTAAEFSVRLAVPPGAREKGAVLRLKFTVPNPVIEQHPSFTLTAKIADARTTKTYSKPGDYVFESKVPETALSGEAIVADFRIDKPFTPGGSDIRILGVAAVSIELSVKS